MKKKSSPDEARTRDLCWHRKLTPTPLGHSVLMQLALLINIVIINNRLIDLLKLQIEIGVADAQT